MSGGEGGSGDLMKLTEDDARAYLQAIKDTLDFHDEREKYDTFLQIMKDYKAKRIAPDLTIERVKELFKAYNKLILGFNKFLSPDKQIKLSEQDKHPNHDDACFNFVRNVKARFGEDSEEFNLFYNTIKFHREGTKIRAMIFQNLAEIIKDHEDLLVEFNHMYGDILAPKSAPANVEHQQLHSQKENERANKEVVSGPISQLDLSNCEQCTPSYRLLPKKYIVLPSARAELGAQVLNDELILTSRKRFCLKVSRKNEHEGILLNCEDDRHELDMLIEHANYAAKQIEQVMNKINTNVVKGDGPFCIKDHFTASNLRIIQRAYAENNRVIPWLRENPSQALPAILSRLKQKQDNWKNRQLKTSWTKMYTKNYHKSLDHRRCYFEEQNQIVLSDEALLAEVKGNREKKREEDNMVVTSFGGERRPCIPHLEYEYPDSEVHQDMYQIIKYSCGEVCAYEEVYKVLKIWRNLLEPMLGVTSQPHGAEGDSKFDPIKKLAKANFSKAEGLKQIIAKDSADHASGPTATPSRPDLPSLERAKPARDGTSVSTDTQYSPQVFYGNDSIYILFRLHQTLYERLQLAKRISLLADKSKSKAKYNRFLTELYNLLDGFSDIKKFEDQCRDIFGTRSYLFLIIHKLIHKLVNQLKAVARDEMNTTLVLLYEYEKLRKPGRFIDKVYSSNARLLLPDKNIYRFECPPRPTKLSIQLLDNEVRVNSPNCHSLYTLATKRNCPGPSTTTLQC